MAKSLEEKIGFVLYDLRIQKAYSQEELANQSEVDRSYISEIERGLKTPSIAIIFRLCSALDIKPWEFIKMVEEWK